MHKSHSGTTIRIEVLSSSKNLPGYTAKKIPPLNTTKFGEDYHGILHIILKLGQCAEQNWRQLRGFDYLAKVITGITVKDEIEIEIEIENTNQDQIAARPTSFKHQV